MRSLAIQIDDLGKQYVAPRGRRADLRESLMSTLRYPFRPKPMNWSHRDRPPRWALRHVSVEIHQGETLGVIGHNGGGKSTLLKLLAGITRPTEGDVEIRGKVAALLDPGAGLHPELTGRENIFLLASLMGMRHGEMKTKFADIIDFASLHNFLDTPLKHYSSGMHVRLAFSVFAHLEADILLVDDVLDEADATFQQAFRTRMLDWAARGRTLIFVSHDLEYVHRLCRRAVVFAEGRLSYMGPVVSALDHYLSSPKVIAELNLCLADPA